MKEPQMLPARLPHILLNGITGIAVGMATDSRLTQCPWSGEPAAIHLIDTPRNRLPDVMGFIQGPDYPTEAELFRRSRTSKDLPYWPREHPKCAVWHKEGSDHSLLTALPHPVWSAKLLKGKSRARCVPKAANGWRSAWWIWSRELAPSSWFPRLTESTAINWWVTYSLRLRSWEKLPR